MWHVIQSPSFTEVLAAVRRMIRCKQRAHDMEKLVAAQYGYLVSFTAAQFQEGEQWGVSLAIRELAKAFVKESEKPEEDSALEAQAALGACWNMLIAGSRTCCHAS